MDSDRSPGTAAAPISDVTFDLLLVTSYSASPLLLLKILSEKQMLMTL